MNPRELTTRVIIQQYGTITDDDGFEKQDWVEFKKSWARKTGLKGKTFYEAAATQSQSDVIFKIRYTKGITSSMRIAENPKVVDGKTVFDNIYNIKADPIDRTGDKIELYITCSKVTAK